MEMVKLNHVSKKFSSALAINNFCLQIEKGEFVGILGSSGSGKTTLLRLIAGLDTPDDGTIEINGNLTNNPRILMSPQQRKVAMVFQDLALWPHMSAVAHLDFVLRSQLQTENSSASWRIKTQNLNKKIKEILEIVKFPFDLSNKYPHQLSGGERQRLAIARSLAQEPKIWLLDEPLANLDTMLKYDLQKEIKRLHKKLGTTLIYVTHDAQEINSAAERLVVMNEGKIVQQGNTKEVFARPKNEFVGRLVGEKWVK
jgi:ABC-type sugar transport system ATPase subunit